MRSPPLSARQKRITGLAAEYAQRGFNVLVEPERDAVPFDLGEYRLSLLGEKGDEHHILEVKTPATHFSVDRLQELAEEVARHPNWRFFLVTANDLLPGEFPASALLLSAEQLEERFEKAGRLLELGDSEAALLALWAVLEGMLRLQAERASLPIERLPSPALIDYLYSHGEISMEQFDEVLLLLDLRNRVAHGFTTPDAGSGATRLQSLIVGLVDEWVPRSAVA
jgi:hypothetical protein